MFCFVLNIDLQTESLPIRQQFLSQSLVTSTLFSVSVNLPFLYILCKHNHIIFLPNISFNIMYSSFIPVVEFISIAVYLCSYNMHCRHMPFKFDYLPVEYLDCFSSQAGIVNITAENTDV